MTPQISVVIPTYNRAADLRRSLNSVVAQTWQRWEALVVDNHSTDDTRQVVESFRDRRIRLLEVNNQGVVAVSRNLGLHNASGDYVAFLDSDDWWLPQKLSRSVAELRAGASVVYHDMYRVQSQSGWHWRRKRTWALKSPVFDDLIESGNALVNSSVVVRRDLLLQVGGLSEDPDMTSWEDYECWLRLARVTEAFCRIPEPLGCYWWGGGNMSSPQRQIRNLGRIRDLYFVPKGRCRDEDMPAWYHYALGRAHHGLHARQQVLHHMGLALRGRLPPRVRLKALITCGSALARRGRQGQVNGVRS